MGYIQHPDDSSKLIREVPVYDKFSIAKSSWEPIYHSVVATATVEYEQCRSVWVGTGGDIKFKMASGDEVDFHNIDDGTLLPIRVTKWTGVSGGGNVLFLY